MPVSTIATSALTRRSEPSMAATVLIRPPTRETPVGIVWVRWTTSSGTTATTFGSSSSSLFCFLSSLAEKPRNARVKDRSAVTPSRLCTFETTAEVSVPFLSMTMKRPVVSGAPSVAGATGLAAVDGSALGPGGRLGRGLRGGRLGRRRVGRGRFGGRGRGRGRFGGRGRGRSGSVRRSVSGPRSARSRGTPRGSPRSPGQQPGVR